MTKWYERGELGEFVLGVMEEYTDLGCPNPESKVGYACLEPLVAAGLAPEEVLFECSKARSELMDKLSDGELV